VQVDASKLTDHNGYEQIIRRAGGMQAGLKILVSAVQSRPSPPFFSATCPTENFSQSVCAQIVPNSGALQRIPTHDEPSLRERVGSRVSAVL
jgi:hypothetical protein